MKSPDPTIHPSTYLFQQYEQTTEFQSIYHNICDKKQKNCFLQGLKSSLMAFIVSILFLKHRFSQLIIFPNVIEAEDFFEQLQCLLKKEKIYLFPSSFKNNNLSEEIKKEQLLQRIKLLSTIEKETVIAITYPEAVVEKMMNREDMKKNSFSIQVGEKLDTKFLDEFLRSYSFEKKDFVYEPGEYSLRGYILDVFSFDSIYPYRIEFFGNHIESIRSFDSVSQLSIKTLQQIRIIPNIYTHGNIFFSTSIVSLFHSYAPNSILWIKDFYNIKQEINTIEYDYKDRTDKIKTVENNSSKTFQDIFFTSKEFLEEIADKKHTLYWGNDIETTCPSVINFSISLQGDYQKKIDLVVEQLEENTMKGIKNMICAASSESIELFEEVLSKQYEDIYFLYEFVEADLFQGFFDKSNRLFFFSERQIFHRPRRKNLHKKKVKSALTKKQLEKMSVGDYVTHIDYGIGRFIGLSLIELPSGKHQEIVRIIYRKGDCLSLGLQALHKITKYENLNGEVLSLSQLGGSEWSNKKQKVKSKIEQMAENLIELYAARKNIKGFSFKKNNYLMAELSSCFEFEETPDQHQSIQDVYKDMESHAPMDRLICGDVGFGKTEIAIRAAFKAVLSGKQVCILVPTTILCFQHYQTFSKRLSNFPCFINFINRFKTKKEIHDVIKNLKKGEIDILIGTHKIITDHFQFNNLGLLIIDEEHKFGVKIKEKIKEMSKNIDVLTLTATPIPRTLQFSLLGARDLSTLHTPPQNRQPIETIVCDFDKKVVQKAIEKELKRGGQVFFIHNRIKNIYEINESLENSFPNIKITVAHGRLKGELLESKIMEFVNKKYDVLVSTNIVEAGLDITNVNTIIINEAHKFGLADLHQLRGRVGRSDIKGYCYLLIPSNYTLPEKSKRRLQTLEEFSDLGDGFKIAMKDLNIRGTGNLLGHQQTGFINELGYNTYSKILEEVISDVKEKTNKDKTISDTTFCKKVDCVIETDLELFIPLDYIQNTTERLEFYMRIDTVKKEEAINEIILEMIDRFGKLPQEIEDLIKISKLKIRAEELSFQKIMLYNHLLTLYLPDIKNTSFYQTEKFTALLEFIKGFPQQVRIQEKENCASISIKNIDSIEKLEYFFSQIENVLIKIDE